MKHHQTTPPKFSNQLVYLIGTNKAANTEKPNLLTDHFRILATHYLNFEPDFQVQFQKGGAK